MKPYAALDLSRSPSASKRDSAPGANAGKQPAAKRRAGLGAGKKQPPAKKLKVEDPHQRSISSFLARPSRNTAAGSTPEIKAEQGAQEVNNSDSAVKEEELEDPLADVDIEGQMKLERAIQRAAAARKQKQQHEAEERVVTDPNEGGFVKQGQDPLEAAAALGAPAIVADLSDADILPDARPEAETAGEATRIGNEAKQSAAEQKPTARPGAPHIPLQAQQSPDNDPHIKVEHDSPSAGAPVKQEEPEDGMPDVSMVEAADREAGDMADEKLQDMTATVKLEGMPDVKLEDPAAEKQLRQLGMFSSARSNTKGVANALIEKRKIRQRKAGIGTPEKTSAAANGATDANALPQTAQSPVPAQRDGTAESGVGLLL